MRSSTPGWPLTRVSCEASWAVSRTTATSRSRTGLSAGPPTTTRPKSSGRANWPTTRSVYCVFGAGREGDHDRADALGRRARDRVDVGQGGDGALDVGRDLELYLLGSGSRVRRRDRDDGDVDVREEVDRQGQVDANSGDRDGQED